MCPQVHSFVEFSVRRRNALFHVHHRVTVRSALMAQHPRLVHVWHMSVIANVVQHHVTVFVLHFHLRDVLHVLPAVSSFNVHVIFFVRVRRPPQFPEPVFRWAAYAVDFFHRPIAVAKIVYEVSQRMRLWSLSTPLSHALR